ncbi:hypothetical protein LZ32DRAFT_651941 [Colletotrichum eremochloae]|nr:hypothetical protein LZ32DRAFT_651941 [Colletotrichum eremochloae]
MSGHLSCFSERRSLQSKIFSVGHAEGPSPDDKFPDHAVKMDPWTNSGHIRRTQPIRSLESEDRQLRSQAATATNPLIAESQTLSPTPTPSPQRSGAQLGGEPDPTDVRFPSSTFNNLTPNDYLRKTDSPKTRTKINRSTNPRQQLDIFLRTIPKGENDWEGKRVCLGLTSLDGIVKLLDDIMSAGCQGQHSDKSPLRGNMPAYITSSASGQRNIGDGSERARILSSFGALVFMGECLVALKHNMDLELVDKAVGDFLFNSGLSRDGLKRKTLQMYRKVPEWITRQADQLYPPCRHRAFEIFLYAAMTIPNYDRLSRSISDDEFLQKAIDTVTSAETPAPPELQAELLAKLPIYLPFVVWARILIQTGIDCYNQLQDALGYSGQFSPEVFRRWLNIYQQKSSRFPARETTSGLVTDPQPESVPKRRRIDSTTPRASIHPTVAPEQPGSSDQTGDSTPCPLVGSNPDESIHQAGVPNSMSGSDGNTMTATDTVHFGKGLSQTMTAEEAMLGANNQPQAHMNGPADWSQHGNINLSGLGSSFSGMYGPPDFSSKRRIYICTLTPVDKEDRNGHNSCTGGYQ